MGLWESEEKRNIEAHSVTERELEVLQLILEGCSNTLMDEIPYITVMTVET